MATYYTPGVYVEEKSMLAPSVAGVATAVPAFIGYTKTKGKKEIQPVTSLLEFENIFGGGCELTCDDKGSLKGHKFVLYDSMRLFYDNGGGFCYVVSIGTYSQTPKADDFTKAIALLAQQTDVTLLVFPDAAMNLSATQLANVQMQALKHCAAVGGRFTILDVKPAAKDSEIEDDLLTFRDGATDALCYGAAYYPFLKTSYAKDIAFEYVLNAIPAEGLEAERGDALELDEGVADLFRHGCQDEADDGGIVGRCGHAAEGTVACDGGRGIGDGAQRRILRIQLRVRRRALAGHPCHVLRTVGTARCAPRLETPFQQISSDDALEQKVDSTSTYLAGEVHLESLVVDHGGGCLHTQDAHSSRHKESGS